MVLASPQPRSWTSMQTRLALQHTTLAPLGLTPKQPRQQLLQEEAVQEEEQELKVRLAR